MHQKRQASIPDSLFVGVEVDVVVVTILSSNPTYEQTDLVPPMRYHNE